jgi:hypothetical protein
MATKVRVNLANAQELLELPGLSTAQVAAIVRFRSEHGPIKDADQLATILERLPADRHAARAGRLLSVRRHRSRGARSLAPRSGRARPACGGQRRRPSPPRPVRRGP